jgi:hypothetical protein
MHWSRNLTEFEERLANLFCYLSNEDVFNTQEKRDMGTSFWLYFLKEWTKGYPLLFVNPLRAQRRGISRSNSIWYQWRVFDLPVGVVRTNNSVENKHKVFKDIFEISIAQTVLKSIQDIMSWIQHNSVVENEINFWSKVTV